MASRHHPTPSAHEVSVALVVGVGVVLGTLLLTLVWVLFLQPSSSSTLLAPGGAPVVDLPVDRVITQTADGRAALVSVTLRLREEDTPRALRTIAAYTPTPVPEEYLPPGKRVPTVPPPTAYEAMVRQQVGIGVSRLSYEQSARDPDKRLLRQTVRDAANQALPGQPVVEVFIREYLVK